MFICVIHLIVKYVLNIAVFNNTHEMHQITTKNYLWKEWRLANKKK